MSKTKSAFSWSDPFLLDDQLSSDERQVSEAARTYCQKEPTKSTKYAMIVAHKKEQVASAAVCEVVVCVCVHVEGRTVETRRAQGFSFTV